MSGSYDNVLVFGHGSEKEGGVIFLGGESIGLEANPELFGKYADALGSLVKDSGDITFYACKLGGASSLGEGRSFLGDIYTHYGGRNLLENGKVVQWPTFMMK